MSEILDHNSTLEVHDAGGEEATITRREVIRFLQDNVVAIHDHAWGDGDIFAEYRCRPGSCSLSDKRFRMLRHTQARFYCSNSADKLKGAFHMGGSHPLLMNETAHLHLHLRCRCRSVRQETWRITLVMTLCLESETDPRRLFHVKHLCYVI